MPALPPFESPATQVLAADHARSVPASSVLNLLRLAERWRIDTGRLLRGLDLREELLEEPLARVPLDTALMLLARTRQLTGEPGLGFHLGLEKRITSYGYLGFAAMSAATVREALELTVRFVPAQTTVFSLRLEREGELAALVIDLHANLGGVEDVFLFDAVLSCWQIGSALTGKELRGSTELTIAEPRYYRRFTELLPNVRFGQAANRLVFDAALLELPLVSADRASLRLAREQCEAALDALISDRGLAQRVRAMIARSSDSSGSLAEVAAAIRISERTLKRKLAALGVSFSELRAEVCRDKAVRLLSSSSLSIDAIAERLGYSTTPNFIRAFRRWTGKTPSMYRRHSLASTALDRRRAPDPTRPAS